MFVSRGTHAWSDSHLLHLLFIQDFLNGQELDNSTRSLVECRALLLRVARVAERHEKPALAAILALALRSAVGLPLVAFFAMLVRIMR